jgi:PadR family transcriptional regulator, regulatory protein PadR
MPRALSFAAVSVLHAVASGTQYGFDVIDATGLPSGTVYPALGRLERDGYVRSRWEEAAQARREKRPPRRYYKATAAGAAVLNEQLARFRAVKPIRTLAPGKVRG